MIVFTVQLTKSFTLLNRSSSYNRKYLMAVRTLLDAKLYFSTIDKKVFSYVSANCFEMQSKIHKNIAIENKSYYTVEYISHWLVLNPCDGPFNPMVAI